MAISRSDVDRGRIDFTGIVTGKRIPPVHPGCILEEEFLKPFGITAYRLAKDIKVPVNRITAIVAGKRALSADTTLRLARYFDMSADFWMTLQARYDLETAARALGNRLRSEVTPRAA